MQEKIEIIKKNNIFFIKKVSSCTNVTNLKSLQTQLTNNLEILRGFKSVLVKQELKLLIPYNFIATQIKYLSFEKVQNNVNILVDNKDNVIKEIVNRENKFKDVLIAVSNSDSSKISYQLNFKRLNEILKVEFMNLLKQYQLLISEVKNNNRIINIEIKGIKLKIQNILDLSKIIFDFFQKPVEFLPLTKIVNNVINKNQAKNQLVKIEEDIKKNIDNNINIIEKLNDKFQEKIDEALSKKIAAISIIKDTPLVLARDISNDNKVDVQKPEVNKQKKQKNNKKVNSMPFSKVDITAVNASLEHKLNIKVQSLQSVSDDIKAITEIENDSLKIKVNKLAIQEREKEKLGKTKVKFTAENAILNQQLTTVQSMIMPSTSQVVVNNLANKHKQTKSIKAEKQDNNFGNDLTKVQKKLKSIGKQKNKRMKKLVVNKSPLSQELVKTQQLLIKLEDKNQKLTSEVNELKIAKTKLENVQKEKAVSIYSLTEELKVVSKQASQQGKKLFKVKKKLKKVVAKNKETNQQLTNVTAQLKQQVQTLSQLPNTDDLVAFTTNYKVTAGVKVNPITEKILLPAWQVANEVQAIPVIMTTPATMLIPTGKQILLQTESWQEVHIGDELTPGFCLQPNLSTI